MLLGRDRFHIPIVSDLSREASAPILSVHVKGTLSHPDFEIVPLPPLQRDPSAPSVGRRGQRDSSERRVWDRESVRRVMTFPADIDARLDGPAETVFKHAGNLVRLTVDSRAPPQPRESPARLQPTIFSQIAIGFVLRLLSSGSRTVASARDR